MQWLVALFLCLISWPAHGQVAVIDQVASLIIGDSQSVGEVRPMAIMEAKRSAIEQAGTYVESLTVVRDSKVARDDILLFTAALLKTEILEEGKSLQGDTLTYRVKIRATIDTQSLENRVNQLMGDREVWQDLAHEQKRIDQLVKENAMLQLQLMAARSQPNMQPVQSRMTHVSTSLMATELFERGRSQFFNGDMKGAEKLYRQAIQIDPKYPPAYNKLGWLLASQDRNDEAEKMFRKALELDPNYGQAMANLGELLAKLGRTEDAEALYSRSIELDPKFARSYYNLAIVLSGQGRKDEARALLLKGQQLSPTESKFADALKYL